MREFQSSLCFCTSFVPNVLRPKSQLSTTYVWVCLLSLTKVEIQRHRWVEREFRRLLYQFSDSFIWTKIHIDEEHNGTSSDRTIYRRSLGIPKRVFEPKTKRRKPLETLGFGNFGGFRKYKVQKTSPSLIRWNRCDSSNFIVPTDPIIGTHWVGSMTKLRRVIVLFGRIRKEGFINQLTFTMSTQSRNRWIYEFV